VTAVSVDGVALSLVCDGCGRIVQHLDDTARQWDVAWPQMQRAGWTGSPVSVGEHYCPRCRPPEHAKRHGGTSVVARASGWLSVGEVDGIAVLALGGDLDLTSDAALAAALGEAIATSRHVLLSMANVDLVDSTVLGTMVRYQQRLAASGGILGLVAPPVRVRRVLDVLGLAEVFAVYPDLESAVRVLGGP
jgi:anti-sigma B factor antagonist